MPRPNQPSVNETVSFQESRHGDGSFWNSPVTTNPEGLRKEIATIVAGGGNQKGIFALVLAIHNVYWQLDFFKRNDENPSPVFAETLMKMGAAGGLDALLLPDVKRAIELDTETFPGKGEDSAYMTYVKEVAPYFYAGAIQNPDYTNPFTYNTSELPTAEDQGYTAYIERAKALDVPVQS